MSNKKTLIQRIPLIPQGNEKQKNKAYEFIRNVKYLYYRTSNQILGQISSAFYENGCRVNIEQLKSEKSELFSYDNPVLKKLSYPEEIDILPLSIKRVEKDFAEQVKNGLASGKNTLKNYKRNAPMPIEKENIKFDIDFENHKNGSPNFSSLKAVLNWANFHFDVMFESNSYGFNLRKTFVQIKSGNYLIEDSLITIEKKKVYGGKTINAITLILKMSIPREVYSLNENIVVGVNLGAENTVVCGLNSDNYKRQYIEPEKVLVCKEQRERAAKVSMEKSLEKASPKHGTHNKLRSINRLAISHKKTIQRINDRITTFIVLFARKNNAKYINIEDMSWYGDRLKDNVLIQNGNYHQFEEMLIRKARKFGMGLRKINPYGLTETCSYCGCQEDGQLISEHRFLCKNPECVSHTLTKGDSKVKYLEPDFNTARNIAKSYQFRKKK